MADRRRGLPPGNSFLHRTPEADSAWLGQRYSHRGATIDGRLVEQHSLVVEFQHWRSASGEVRSKWRRWSRWPRRHCRCSCSKLPLALARPRSLSSAARTVCHSPCVSSLRHTISEYHVWLDNRALAVQYVHGLADPRGLQISAKLPLRHPHAAPPRYRTRNVILLVGRGRESDRTTLLRMIDTLYERSSRAQSAGIVGRPRSQP